MRIVFFTRLFYPHIGGVEKHVLLLSKELVKKGHEVTVITEYLNHSNHLNLNDSVDGIEIIRIKVGKDDWFKKFSIWKELFKHIKIIKQADIVHCHDVFFWYFPFRFIFPTKKVFTTFHGYEGNNIPSKKAILMHKIAEIFSFGNICIGDFLKKWYGTKPNYVSYGAVEILESQKSKVKSQNLNSKAIKILYIGRLEEEAGILEYLKTLNMLKNKKYNISLEVLGDGNQRKQAEDFVKKNNLDVNFKGFIGDIDRFLDDCDYVFVSRYLGILEAFAKKKFVFSIYNNIIKKDYLQMTPFSKFISISGSDTDLVSNIIYFFENTKVVSEKVEKAYDWVEKQNWEKLTNQYVSLWTGNK